jgi:hypothetical protein
LMGICVRRRRHGLLPVVVEGKQVQLGKLFHILSGMMIYMHNDCVGSSLSR